MARKSAYSLVGPRAEVPQTEQVDPAQVKNSAGGYTFELTDTARVARFLVLGSDSATYYASARELTKDNAAVIVRMAVSDGPALVEQIATISESGRAPKNDAALFALAIAVSFGNDETRKLALAALPRVARIGTHLFMFAGYVEQFRGWGRGLRSAVARWYLDRDVDSLAYQVLKYRQREGWSHRDLLRLSHPQTAEIGRKTLFDFLCRREVSAEAVAAVPMLEGFIKAQETGADIPALIRQYRLAWEMIPDTAMNVRATWDAFLDVGVPPTALMRQLPRLTNLEMLSGKGNRAGEVAERLADPVALKKARVHPVNVLVAQRTYQQGHGMKGSLTWRPARAIVDALDAGFYAAYGAVEPTGKRLMLALDVSGSMGTMVSGLPVSCREAATALALVTANVEKNYVMVGFTSQSGSYSRGDTVLQELAISPRQRLDDALRVTSGLPFGGTDCSLPFRAAEQGDMGIEGFITLTDNETWAGPVHPHKALNSYRARSGIAARSVVVGMTSTGFSIADPKDAGSMDCVGFDSALPHLISDFVRG
jgi:60 kDa SS-A/Ro ribonucleoprotein